MLHLLLVLLLVLATTSRAATTNTVASVGVPATGNVLIYSDTTGYNTAPGSLTVSGTNASLPGVLSANGGAFTNTLTLNGSTVSTASAANPTATIGLTTVNGSASTFLRSDGAPALPSTGGAYSGSVLVPWVDTNNTITLQWKKAPQVWEFTGAAGEWTAFTANSGSASVGAVLPDTVDSGVASVATGTLTNGTSGVRSSTVSFVVGTNQMAVLMRVRSPASLSSDTDGYEFYAGLGDSTGNAEPIDGAYFYYLHSVSNGVWCAKTSNNSNRTFASGAPTTPPTVVVDTWYSLLLEASNTVVNFWISTNDGQTWQWIGFSSSNLPDITGRAAGAECFIRKVGGSVGTADRSAYLGRAEFWPARAN